MPKAKIITGLDIGTSSIKALTVFKNSNSSDLEVLGQVQIPNTGMRRGTVVNPGEVSKNVYQTLYQLQNQVGQKIGDIYVNIDGSHISVVPSHGTVVVSRADQKISQEDIGRVIQAAKTFSLPVNKEILDVFPREFIVDGENGIKVALGMQGLRLEVEVLALCAFSPYLKNLTQAILNAGFQIGDVIPSPLASARAVLTPQQKELGVAVIDIGAGSTGLAVYEEGDLAHLIVFPIGSSHITNDIAIGLRTDIDIAERIKREFGSCIFGGKTSTKKIEKLEIPQADSPLTFSRKMLVDIIEARVSEIFDLINEELKKISSRAPLPAGIVLAGGGSRLPKIVELAKKELKLPARIGIPQGLVGLEKDPSWSTVCGLVLGGIDLEREEREGGFSIPGKGIGNKIKRIFKIFIP